MSLVQVNITLTGVERLRKREINDALREAIEAMVLRWRRRYLPKHFTHGGARVYGFAARQGQFNPHRRGTYTNRKLRWFSHTLPNVYTGELRRLVTQGPQRVKATVTSTRARGRALLPRKANFRLHELEIVSASERQDLERFLVQMIELRLARRGAASASAEAGFNVPSAAAAA